MVGKGLWACWYRGKKEHRSGRDLQHQPWVGGEEGRICSIVLEAINFGIRYRMRRDGREIEETKRLRGNSHACMI